MFGCFCFSWLRLDLLLLLLEVVLKLLLLIHEFFFSHGKCAKLRVKLMVFVFIRGFDWLFTSLFDLELFGSLVYFVELD